MGFLLYISDYMIPLVLFYIIGFGLLMKVNVYDEFVDGAKDGFKIVLNIMPTLVGLMVGVGVLRASGALDILSGLIRPITNAIKFPSDLVPLVFVRMFSSSASTSLVLDIFKSHGPDSYIGRLTSVMMGCTETIFYTMSVYFLAAKVRKTRYTLAGALLANFAGIGASWIITILVFGR